MSAERAARGEHIAGTAVMHGPIATVFAPVSLPVHEFMNSGANSYQITR